MFFRKSYALQALLFMSGVVFFTSCEREFNEIGVDLVEDGSFEVKSKIFEVNASGKNRSAVRTDAMPLIQLSDYTDPVFGQSKASYVTQLRLSVSAPAFGKYSAATEAEADTDTVDATIEENERVTRVYLDLPFYSTANDTLEDTNAKIPYEVDSVFGDLTSPIQVTIQEYTKYLRDRDPATNFQGSQEYYSNEDPTPFLSTILFDGSYELDLEEILLFENEDDPATEDVNEAENFSARFSPRLRIELDAQFFQEKIIDNEGEDVLANQDLFLDYLRGIYMTIDHPLDDLKLLLDVNGTRNNGAGDPARVVIKYDYDAYNEDDEVVEVAKDSFLLNLSGSKSINVYEEMAYPAAVTEAVAAGESAQRIYLKGESGASAMIDISGGETTEDFLLEAKENNWLINEANLYVYPDTELTGNQDLPYRLFLYDFENNTSLLDYRLNASENISNLPELSYLLYDGILEEEDGEAPYYRFRITEHIKSIINNDSTNVQLGLSVTGNILNGNFVTAFDANQEETSAPQAAAYYPFSLVLYGANLPLEEQDKRIRLELIYTDPTVSEN